jgi:F-type H+-transporting ATPase subunit a
MIIFSPLEQFEIIILYLINLNQLILPITSLIIFLFIILILINRFFYIGLINASIIQNEIQLLIELIYQFIIDEIYYQQVGEIATIFFISLFFYIFLIIFILNFFSLFPSSESITAQFVITFFLALSFNISFFFIGFNRYNFDFFKLFVPTGIPIIILPLVVFTEILSYLIRPLSMALRLFANSMAGHTLLHILGSFVNLLLILGTIFGVFFSIIIIIIIFNLELIIAFLQSYIFVTLLSIYSKDCLLEVNH